MSKEDREMWRTNIENSADTVSKIYEPNLNVGCLSSFIAFGAVTFV